MERTIANSAFEIDLPISRDAPLTMTIAIPSAISIQILTEPRVAASARPARS